MLLLFGTIASLGLKTLIDAKVDLMRPKNLVIVSSTLTIGLGGFFVQLGDMHLQAWACVRCWRLC